jgi:hypothetical protein
MSTYCKRRIPSLPSCARYGPGAHLIGAPRRWRSGAPRLCGAALLACKTGSRRLPSSLFSPPAVAVRSARGACATRGPPHHGLAVPAVCQACGRRGGERGCVKWWHPFARPRPTSSHAACTPPGAARPPGRRARQQQQQQQARRRAAVRTGGAFAPYLCRPGYDVGATQLQQGARSGWRRN